MVSQYNEFVREYAKKCRKQGKKFELADAAKAWRGIKGGDWRSFLGLKSLKKSPVWTTSSHGAYKPTLKDKAIERFAALRRQQTQRKPDIIHRPGQANDYIY
jgi:hypothetical protein